MSHCICTVHLVTEWSISSVQEGQKQQQWFFSMQMEDLQHRARRRKDRRWNGYQRKRIKDLKVEKICSHLWWGHHIFAAFQTRMNVQWISIVLKKLLQCICAHFKCVVWIVVCDCLIFLIFNIPLVLITGENYSQQSVQNWKSIKCNINNHCAILDLFKIMVIQNIHDISRRIFWSVSWCLKTSP